MNKCVVCGTHFKPTKQYSERKTCSNECLKIHMKNLVPEAFLEKSFEKGSEPFNKGLPQKEWLSAESIEQCSKTYIQNQNCKSPLYGKSFSLINPTLVKVLKASLTFIPFDDCI